MNNYQQQWLSELPSVGKGRSAPFNFYTKSEDNIVLSIRTTCSREKRTGHVVAINPKNNKLFLLINCERVKDSFHLEADFLVEVKLVSNGDYIGTATPYERKGDYLKVSFHIPSLRLPKDKTAYLLLFFQDRNHIVILSTESKKLLFRSRHDYTSSKVSRRSPEKKYDTVTQHKAEIIETFPTKNLLGIENDILSPESTEWPILDLEIPLFSELRPPESESILGEAPPAQTEWMMA